METTQLEKEEIRVMLHAIGIGYTKNGAALLPNKRYCPYPKSYRNYYQIENDEVWNGLVTKGFAIYRKGNESWQCVYHVTDLGKDALKKIGYKWHESP